MYFSDRASKVNLNELAGVINDNTKLGNIKRQLNVVKKGKKVVSVPLPKHEKQKVGSLFLCFTSQSTIFSSPEPKAQGELIVWGSSRRPSVRLSVRASTLSNMNISETGWPIIIKFHQEHHWGGGLTALVFG